MDDDVLYKLTSHTAKKILESQEKLKIAKWSNGEANLESDFSKIACSCCEEAWDEIKIEYPDYINVTIYCIAPDVTIRFIFPDESVLTRKIELKSGQKKHKIIPGSTIGNLDINQPLIFCLRPKIKSGYYEIKYSQYHTAMGKTKDKTDLFQDRTPRPYVDFSKMNDPEKISEYITKPKKDDWISYYGECGYNRVFNLNKETSWQDTLVKKIVHEFIKNTSEEEFKTIKNKLILNEGNII
jgi:hypothetical protein